MAELVWLVDEYCDRITECGTKAVDKKDKWRKGFGYSPLMRFATKQQAIIWMLSRAEKRVETARGSLKKEESRLKNCRKKAAKDSGGGFSGHEEPEVVLCKKCRRCRIHLWPSQRKDAND